MIPHAATEAHRVPETSTGLDAHLVVDGATSSRGHPTPDGRNTDDAFRLDAEVTIRPGETVALLGPNGAGKSTAVAVLAGLLAVDDGHVHLGQRVLDDPATDTFVPARRRRVGVVFQDLLLLPHLTARDNVAFGLRARGIRRGAAGACADQWLTRLDLADLADRRPSQLSGGQAQRVALARALVTEPDLILLDEPLSALDVTTRMRLRRILAVHLADFPGPRLVITHDPVEAFLLADRIHVVEHGTITQVGTPDDIRLRPRTPWIADLAGANLLSGTARDGAVDLDGLVLHVADHRVSGPVLVTIRPTAVTVHRDRPEGSQRNAWPTRIERLEHLGDRVRLRTTAPLALTVEVTRESTAVLALAPDREIWLAIKATEVGVQPEQDPAPASA